MKSNYHTHTTWCDGADTPEAMVLAAVEKDFDRLGFSSHSDMLSDIPAYIREIRDCARRHRNEIDVWCGLEAEGGDALGYRDQLDYVIGSLHYLRAPDGARVCVDESPERFAEGLRLHYAGDMAHYVHDYYAQLKRMLTQDFDLLGHPDLIRKYNRASAFFDEEAAWYRGEVEAAADAIAASGHLVEVNTGAISRGWLDDAYPSPFFRSLLMARGVKFVLSSDAHAVSGLDCAFDRFGGVVPYEEMKRHGY